MSSIASQMVAARLQTAFDRVQTNLNTISGSTGLTFRGFLIKSSLEQSVDPAVSDSALALSSALSLGSDNGKAIETLLETLTGKGAGQFDTADIADIIKNAAKPSAAETESSTNEATTAPQTPATAYDALIIEAAEAYDVDSSLIKALIYGESGFDPNSTSGAGAMGLMQLMPYTAEALAVTDAYNPADNIDGGTRLLRSLLERYEGDARKAVAAYNLGAAGLDRYGLTDLTNTTQLGQLPSQTRSLLQRVEEYLGGAKAMDTLCGRL